MRYIQQNWPRQFSAAEKVGFLFVAAIALTIAIHLAAGFAISSIKDTRDVPLGRLEQVINEQNRLTLPLEIGRAIAPLIVFPLFSLFALPSILKATNSNPLRILLMLAFITFPLLLFFVLVFLAIVFGSKSLFIGL